MDTTFYIAQGISVLTCLVGILMMQFKSMKKILAGQIVANLLTASTYFLLGGISGAGICFIAILQSVVMFFYSIKQTAPHKWVIALFIVLYISCSVFYYKSPVDILSALAAVCFAISVVQVKPCFSRLWYLFNPLLWMAYDLLIPEKAYVNFVMHTVLFCSTFIAILRNYVKKVKD